MQVSLKFDVDKTPFGDQNYSCRVGCHELRASTRAELQQKVNDLFAQIVIPPTIAVVRCDSEVRVLLATMDRIDTYQLADPDTQGHSMVRCTGSSFNGDIVDEARRMELHLARQQWDGTSDDAPSWLHESSRDDFAAWVRFQRAYKIARESGCDAPMCHELACDAMHV